MQISTLATIFLVSATIALGSPAPTTTLSAVPAIHTEWALDPTTNVAMMEALKDVRKGGPHVTPKMPKKVKREVEKRACDQWCYDTVRVFCVQNSCGAFSCPNNPWFGTCMSICVQNCANMAATRCC